MTTMNNVLFSTASDKKVILHMSDKLLEDMMHSGLYFFWLFGHMFYIEVLPVAFNANGMKFLKEEGRKWLIPALGNEALYEFNDVMQLDFLMERFNSKT